MSVTAARVVREPRSEEHNARRDDEREAGLRGGHQSSEALDRLLALRQPADAHRAETAFDRERRERREAHRILDGAVFAGAKLSREVGERDEGKALGDDLPQPEGPDPVQHGLVSRSRQFVNVVDKLALPRHRSQAS